ncbi:hypothetical protein GOV14_04445 [Candidatus Pacearchaeota archaeon]|nr:hypothetical protein [Candidatus Pacearchaeota archaeon]
MNKKAEKSIVFGILLIYLVLFFISVGLVAGALDKTFTGNLSGFVDTWRLRTLAIAESGYDNYDFQQPAPPPSDYAQFYSVVVDGSSYNLAIDLFNNSGLPRIINVTLTSDAGRTGVMNISWPILTGTTYRGNITYFGEDSSYATSIGSANLSATNSYAYSVINNQTVYAQVYIDWYNYGPDTPTATINSSLGTNKTLQGLYCKAASINDPEGSSATASVRWYKNGVLDNTQNPSTVYSDGANIAIMLDSDNTTRTENWSCSMRLYDGTNYSSWSSQSENLTIENTLPTVTLSTPSDDTASTDRTPTFTWTSDDDDSGDVAGLTYELNLTSNPSSLCSDNNWKGSDTVSKETISTSETYTIPNTLYLKCLLDNTDSYDWAVRAWDGADYGAWTTAWNYSVNSVVDINLNVDALAFGSLNRTNSNDTTDDNPAPFNLSNDGNVEVNVTVNFTSLWASVAIPSDYYNYTVRTEGLPSCYFSARNDTWYNANTVNEQLLTRLNFTAGYQSGCDDALIDISLLVPPSEPGSTSYESTIWFTASLGEAY